MAYASTPVNYFGVFYRTRRDGLTDGEHRLQAQPTDGVGLVPEPCPGLTVTVDAAAPVLVDYSPANGTLDVPLDASVVLTFSEPIEVETLAFETSPDPGGWWVQWNAGHIVATLSHAAFALDQAHTFTLSQAHDAAHKPLTPATWTFTTAPQLSHRVYLPLAFKAAP